MKILFIGDIVAEPGRKAVKKILPDLKNELNIDLVLANAENIAGGRGITVDTVKELQDAGIDYFTSGDHVFWQKETEKFIDSVSVLRPANYPKGTPGKGFEIIDTGKNGRVLLINLMGRTSFGGIFSYLDDPFSKFDEILEENREGFSAIIVDFHGEATSEKQAFGFYADGKVTAVLGTHTHVPTCDHRVLPKGTMYVTDVGMTGVLDSVLGVKEELIIDLLRTARNQKFEWKNTGTKAFRSVLLDTVKKSIERIDKVLASQAV
jgi:metallophosphoesterase (TIGR00282 family)